jgi:hypothetical protein
MQLIDSIYSVHVHVLLFFCSDVDYEINICTGEKALDASAVLKIFGSKGTVSIPLSTTKSGSQPFQSKSTDEFTHRAADVGQIRRISIEHHEKDQEKVWHVKTIQIVKETACFK